MQYQIYETTQIVEIMLEVLSLGLSLVKLTILQNVLGKGKNQIKADKRKISQCVIKIKHI